MSVCIDASRPGELISVAQLPLRPAAPAPHFSVQRRQPVVSLLRGCRLGLASGRRPAGTRPLPPRRPCAGDTQMETSWYHRCSTQRTIAIQATFETLSNMQVCHLPCMASATNRENVTRADTRSSQFALQYSHLLHKQVWCEHTHDYL